MVEWVERKRLLASVLIPSVLFLCAAVSTTGCNKQKQTDAGKTYTSNAQGKQGGGAQSGGGSSDSGQSAAKPLDAPADTTNGKASTASDAGSSDATRGQAVAEPGAPVEHDPQPKPAPKTPPSNGHS